MNGFECINSAPVQVSIGDFILFAENIKITGNSIINEQSNISGCTSITNSSVKNTSVTLNGRLACDSDFKSFILYAENILRNKTNISFQYKNISFNQCILKSYSAENNDSGITDARFVFSVPELSEVVQNAD
ncbi:MAG: hypothetical protein PUA51_07570 [Oscillospiraceae bacterium]|nr:hypothetical protein [Oscillospiraceae bacterium]